MPRTDSPISLGVMDARGLWETPLCHRRRRCVGAACGQQYILVHKNMSACVVSDFIVPGDLTTLRIEVTSVRFGGSKSQRTKSCLWESHLWTCLALGPRKIIKCSLRKCCGKVIPQLYGIRREPILVLAIIWNGLLVAFSGY